MDYPAEKNNFLVEHVVDIKNSYRRLLLKELIPAIQSDEQFARQLFYAPFALVSHDKASDPVFNYA
ncbi:MAG: MEKHLA domain-containing protein, partial [Methylobacter sp.]